MSTRSEWTTVLKLADLWSFASVRARAIRKLDARVTAFERIVLARAYEIEEWIDKALYDLCAREEPVTVDEMREMTYEDIAFVAEVRERARAPAELSTEDISSRISDYIARRRDLSQESDEEEVPNNEDETSENETNADGSGDVVDEDDEKNDEKPGQ